MNLTWATTNHSDYPALLKGRILQTFKEEKRKASKQNDPALIDIISRAQHAAHSLAEILTRAYAARVIADYEPQVRVQFRGTPRFSLQNIDITEAHNWESKVDAFTRAILAAWKQINA